jgi:hypothetical protein
VQAGIDDQTPVTLTTAASVEDGLGSPVPANPDGEPAVGLQTGSPTAPQGDKQTLPLKADDQDISAATRPLAANASNEKSPPQTGANRFRGPMSVGDLVSFSQGNFAAFLEAGQIWTAGVQDLTYRVVTSAQASVDETLTALTTLSAISPYDALAVPTRLAHSGLERALAESSRISHASVKLLERTLVPFKSRATLAVEKFRDHLD